MPEWATPEKPAERAGLRFRLQLEGSLNHLTAKLSARYGIHVLTLSSAPARTQYVRDIGAEKAALESLVLAYADEVRNLAPLRVAIVDPGATATQMRARAFPGEDQMTIKTPSVVADAVADLLCEDFETGHRLRINS